MQRPLCKVCGNEHYASEAHVWRGRDFDFAPPDAPKLSGIEPYVSKASAKSERERKSRYRTPEAAEAYRKYKREYMAKRRAGVYNGVKE